MWRAPWDCDGLGMRSTPRLAKLATSAAREGRATVPPHLRPALAERAQHTPARITVASHGSMKSARPHLGDGGEGENAQAPERRRRRQGSGRARLQKEESGHHEAEERRRDEQEHSVALDHPRPFVPHVSRVGNQVEPRLPRGDEGEEREENEEGGRRQDARGPRPPIGAEQQMQEHRRGGDEGVPPG